MKIKVITVAGTRPELIRLSEIIKKFDLNFNHLLVYTNQNYDKKLKDIFFKELNIRQPDYQLNLNVKSYLTFIGEMLIKIEKILLDEKPDAFFILGDTNSCLSALVAKKLRIPIFHFEAGNRCFDQKVPEEINRKIVDNLSDINLTYSSFAKNNLINEGFRNDRVIVVGSPLKEILIANKRKIDRSSILKKFKIKKNQYFLVSYHREENVDDLNRLKKFVKIIDSISLNYKKKIIISTHPRTKEKIKKVKLQNNKDIIYSEPFGYHDYIKLQKEALVVISDSGSIPEETSILNLKSIILRDAFERQETMENDTILMSGLEKDNLFNCIDIVLKNNNKKNIHEDYDHDNVSSKMVKIVSTYIPLINKWVWGK